MKIKNLKTIKIGKYRYSFINWREFLLLYAGIFTVKGYSFETDSKKPFIIDCGSHTGMSVLGFKKQYPNSEIIAFEPNPDTFEILKKNVSQNDLENIKLVNAALGDKRGTINFYVNKDNTWSWGDSAFKSAFIKGKHQVIKVKSVLLSSYIKGEVDLIKINIEGFEGLVLKEIQGKLKYVKELMLQYHGDGAIKNNDLDEIFDVLDNNSYKYTIRQLKTFGIPFKIGKSQINRSEPYYLFIHAKRK